MIKFYGFMKIAVLGAGHLGRIHLDIIKSISEYDLVGFYDPDTQLSKKISKEFSVRSFDSMSSLIDETDIVDIVTPTLSHFECAKQAILNYKHVFIEKPVTKTVAEADELIVMAERHDVKVQVGHVERFNPAFTAAKPYIKNPLFIETHRLSPFNPRGTDVSVVLDLMIHDIDIILNIVESDVTDITTSGVAVASDSADISNARIEFENGCVANLTASRVSLKKMRKARIFQKDAYVSIDFLEKKTEIVSLSDESSWNPFVKNIEVDTDGNKKSVRLHKPRVKKLNAIKEELVSFAKAIKNNSLPVVTLNDGCKAIRVAHTVMDKINERITKTLSNA